MKTSLEFTHFEQVTLVSLKAESEGVTTAAIFPLKRFPDRFPEPFYLQPDGFPSRPRYRDYLLSQHSCAVRMVLLMIGGSYSFNSSLIEWPRSVRLSKTLVVVDAKRLFALRLSPSAEEINRSNFYHHPVNARWGCLTLYSRGRLRNKEQPPIRVQMEMRLQTVPLASSNSPRKQSVRVDLWSDSLSRGYIKGLPLGSQKMCSNRLLPSPVLLSDLYTQELRWTSLLLV